MSFLQNYKDQNIRTISICFCILNLAQTEERKLYEIQEEMSEAPFQIRQSYVFGDQTVNSTEFYEFRPGFYTKIERADTNYSAHEALLLAAGMMEKEGKAWEQDDTHRNLLVILGEEPASDSSYEKIKQWVCEKKSSSFELLIL